MEKIGREIFDISAFLACKENRDNMDKLINKVKKDEKKASGAIKKGLKDTKTLLKADKKFDKKIKMAEKKK